MIYLIVGVFSIGGETPPAIQEQQDKANDGLPGPPLVPQLLGEAGSPCWFCSTWLLVLTFSTAGLVHECHCFLELLGLQQPGASPQAVPAPACTPRLAAVPLVSATKCVSSAPVPPSRIVYCGRCRQRTTASATRPGRRTSGLAFPSPACQTQAVFLTIRKRCLRMKFALSFSVGPALARRRLPSLAGTTRFAFTS